jgi:hypothetical protein
MPLSLITHTSFLPQTNPWASKARLGLDKARAHCTSLLLIGPPEAALISGLLFSS